MAGRTGCGPGRRRCRTWCGFPAAAPPRRDRSFRRGGHRLRSRPRSASRCRCSRFRMGTGSAVVLRPPRQSLRSPAEPVSDFTEYWVEQRLRPLVTAVAGDLTGADRATVASAIDAISSGAFAGICGEGEEHRHASTVICGRATSCGLPTASLSSIRPRTAVTGWKIWPCSASSEPHISTRSSPATNRPIRCRTGGGMTCRFTASSLCSLTSVCSVAGSSGRRSVPPGRSSPGRTSWTGEVTSRRSPPGRRTVRRRRSACSDRRLRERRRRGRRRRCFRD